MRLFCYAAKRFARNLCEESRQFPLGNWLVSIVAGGRDRVYSTLKCVRSFRIL